MSEIVVIYNKLSEEDVFYGLLDYGLFSEKIPPCFSSVGLADFIKNDKDLIKIFNLTDEKDLKKALDKRAYDYIRYEAVRDINIPRSLGIPHPESYAVQALAIKKYWIDIQSHCAQPDVKVSRIHVRSVGGGRIFEMNYKGEERFQLEEEEINWMTGAMFLAKADISKCFHSIYTHSIPWALNGRSEAKSKRGLLELSGNLLDKCTQNIRDKQTNGLLIGPHSSNIISEIILTRIDNSLLKKGYEKLKRHIDDYQFYAESYEQAEKFLHDLGLLLREYELNLNEKKTSILSLPRPSDENWIRELNSFSFSSEKEVKYFTIRMFLDLALELAQSAGTSAPLNYAIKMMPEKLNERAKHLYVQEAINLSLSFPYLAPYLDEYVFEKYLYEGIEKKIGDFANKILMLGIKKLYPDAIAHGFYYAIKYEAKLEITSEKVMEIMEFDDCIVKVLLLEYAKRNKLKEILKVIKKSSDSLKSGEKRDVERQWLFVYQTWTEDELKGNGHKFLAELKKLNFSFLSNDAMKKKVLELIPTD